MKYFYTAKSLKGKEISGQREVKDKKELAKILRQEGFVLTSVIIEKKKFRLKGPSPLPFFGGVSLKEKIIFTRNLKVMVSAGVNLPQALNTLATQSKNKKFEKVILKIRSDILQGRSFSEAIRKYPNIFSDIYYYLVRIGEESGTLAKSLENLTSQMEKEHELKSNIKSALMYPTVIILAMIGIAILMLLVVVPQLVKTFEEMGIELPFTTKLIMSLSLFLVEKWYLIILIILIFIFLFRVVFKIKEGRKAVDYIFLRIPIFSPLIKKSTSAYVIRTLSTLMDAGLPVLRSLGVLSNSLGNFYFKKSMIEAGKKVKAGKSLAQSLEPFSNLYSPMVLQMMEVGEKTGQTTDILKKTADSLEEEVTRITRNLASLVEPIIILLIGAAVGFFAVSIIQPIYQMMGAI